METLVCALSPTLLSSNPISYADSKLLHAFRGCVSGAQMTNVRDKVHAHGFDALDGYDEIE